MPPPAACLVEGELDEEVSRPLALLADRPEVILQR